MNKKITDGYGLSVLLHPTFYGESDKDDRIKFLEKLCAEMGRYSAVEPTADSRTIVSMIRDRLRQLIEMIENSSEQDLKRDCKIWNLRIAAIFELVEKIRAPMLRILGDIYKDTDAADFLFNGDYDKYVNVLLKDKE